jgi:hypothetical protein
MYVLNQIIKNIEIFLRSLSFFVNISVFGTSSPWDYMSTLDNYIPNARELLDSVKYRLFKRKKIRSIDNKNEP